VVGASTLVLVVGAVGASTLVLVVGAVVGVGVLFTVDFKKLVIVVNLCLTPAGIQSLKMIATIAAVTIIGAAMTIIGCLLMVLKMLVIIDSLII